MLTSECNYYGNHKQGAYLRARQAEIHAWDDFKSFPC